MVSSLSFSVEACFLPAIWVVKLLFPPIDLVAAVFSPSLSRLWWLVSFLLCFSFLSVRFRQESWNQVVQLGEVEADRVSQRWFWPFLHLFSSSFRSQNYTTPLLFSRHAPLSRVPHHRPLMPTEARFMPVVRVRPVVYTPQRALCSLARVTATLRFFFAVRGGAVINGGWSLARWHRWRRVLPRAAVCGRVHPCLFCRLPGFCVFYLFVCVFSCFSCTVCLCITRVLLKFLLASC